MEASLVHPTQDEEMTNDEMSAWATNIYLSKYSWRDEDGNPSEVWPDTAYRVVRNVLGALGYTDRDYEFQQMVKYISQRKFMPGGRYLYGAGKQFHAINNCFSGDTRFVTDEGVRSLKEAEGQIVRVRNRFGIWEEATVNSFGKQKLYRIHLSNGDSIDATANHRWWQNDGSRVTTDELVEIPFSVVAVQPDMDPDGIRHGIIYGDGTLDGQTKNFSRWDVVNEEKDGCLIDFFDPQDVRRNKVTQVVMQPAQYKELPHVYSPEYARGFIAGLIATDGNVNSNCSVTIAHEGLEESRRIAEIAVAGGFVVSSVRINSGVSPYTGEARELCFIYIKPFSTKRAILLPSHQEQLNGRQRKRMMQLGVEFIEELEGEHETYCVVAPQSESFTLANGLITSNCFLYRCADSREGWAELSYKAIMALTSGGGVGVVYSDVRHNGSLIKSTGGLATGPLSPAQMINEIARHVEAGGSRRAALWGGLHWWHKDIFDWITIKDWSQTVKDSKDPDKGGNYNNPAPLDMTNISVILDSAFFTAYNNENHPQHEHAHKVYWMALEHMLANGEPGFSIDTGQNARENLRNPCPVAGHTHVLTADGYRSVSEIIDIPQTVWTGKQWAHNVVFTETNPESQTLRVKMSGGRIIDADSTHPFIIERYEGSGNNRKLVSVDRVEAQHLEVGDIVQVSLPDFKSKYFDKESYTLGWMYGDGSFGKNGFSELTLCSDASKACFPYLTGYRSVNENDSRGYIRMYFDKRYQGRVKRFVDKESITPSFIAGLFDADGNFDPRHKAIRLASIHQGFLHDIRRGLEAMGILSTVSKSGTNKKSPNPHYKLVINADYRHKFAELIPVKRVKIDLEEYKPYRKSVVKIESIEPGEVQPVYCADVHVSEHTFQAEGVIISNCEVTSEDDSDVCCLGSINLARIESLEELEEITSLGTLFLLAGTVYSDIPHEEVRRTREKNRRIGLGFMGVHEWLIARGYDYEVTPELHEWLGVYERVSDQMSVEWADKHKLSHPIKKRAVAPTGTIGILAETTTGIEPVFAAAYIRKFLDGKVQKYQYVIDPTVERMKNQYGIDPDKIDTAWSLSYTPEKRVKFQADIQKYVDMGISSTLNLPEPITDPDWVKEYGDTFMKHLPNLRGLTVYPNGARSGQPLEAVSYAEAVGKVGVTFDDNRDEQCRTGQCGV